MHRSPFDDPFFRRGPGNEPYGWDPHREIERMRREIDAMMRDAFQGHDLHSFGGHPYANPPAPGSLHPRYRSEPGSTLHEMFSADLSSGNFDIQDKGEGYLVRLAIPGADRKHIKVDIDERTLTVSGRQRQSDERTDQFGNTTFKQQMTSTFKRSVSLPGPVRPESMKTRFRGEVLEISVAKAG